MRRFLSAFWALFLCLGAANAQTPSSVPLSPTQIQAATNTAIAPGVSGGITALSLNAIINQFDPFTTMWFDASNVQNGLINKWGGAGWVPLVITAANGGSGATTATANTVFAGPATGSAAAPAFRSIVPADLSVTCSTTQIFYDNAGAVACGSVTFTGGLISGSGLGLTVAGTSGGIPYFASGTTWASSAALAANQLVIGGGAGAAPVTLGSSGTATTLLHGNASGPPAFSAVTAADITTALAAPPPIGATPNTLSGSTLTIGAPGLVGDGVTINNTALQAALTAVASGGYIHLPCGVFKITTGMAVTIASGSTATIEGAGTCTKILSSTFTGTAFAFSYTDATSAVAIRNVWMATDTSNLQTAISLTLASNNTLEAYSAQNVIENVQLTGSDYPSLTGVKNWQYGITQQNVGNVAYNNILFIGGNCSAGICQGTGINLLGKIGTSYGVVADVVNSSFNLCNIGIFYGDWFQGLSVTNSNFTGVALGIDLITNPTGIEDGLSITNSQINYATAGLNIQAGTGQLANLYANNNIFLPLAGFSSNAIVIGKVINFTIIGNTVNSSTNVSNGIGIGAASSFGIIAHNELVGQATAIYVLSSVANTSVLFDSNNFASNTTDYSVGASSSGYIIIDTTPRTIAGLFACLAGTAGSKAYVHDTVGAAAPTYHLAVAGAGATTVDSPVYCYKTTPGWVYD